MYSTNDVLLELLHLNLHSKSTSFKTCFVVFKNQIDFSGNKYAFIEISKLPNNQLDVIKIKAINLNKFEQKKQFFLAVYNNFKEHIDNLVRLDLTLRRQTKPSSNFSKAINYQFSYPCVLPFSFYKNQVHFPVCVNSN